MARKKLKLAFITNNSARKATYHKRKKSMLKKISELSTLCGINGCMIIYSPYESSGPEVWPSVSGAQQVLAEFKRMPQMARSRKMMNQESFLRQRLDKIDEQLMKLKKENREKEITHVVFEILNGGSLQNLGLNAHDMDDVISVTRQMLKKLCQKMDTFQATEGMATQLAATTNGTQRDGDDLAYEIQMRNPFINPRMGAPDSDLAHGMGMLPFVNNSIYLSH